MWILIIALLLYGIDEIGKHRNLKKEDIPTAIINSVLYVSVLSMLILVNFNCEGILEDINSAVMLIALAAKIFVRVKRSN